MSNEEDPLRSEIKRLEDMNRSLEEQLKFARQKASLYYITASELDALKRGSQTFIESKSVATATDIPLNNGCDCFSQTNEIGSNEIALKTELELARTEIESLRSYIESLKRSEPLHTRLATFLGSCARDDFLVDEYVKLTEEILKQNRLSVNHSVEIKRRDEMISSLFDKIRIIEEAFSKKLHETQRLADTRQQVIQALGEQVKEAVRQVPSNPSTEWAIQAEMEDLRAELSMARTNWAATRDELIRLQFRVGADGNGGDVSPMHFPNPILSLLDKQTRESGIISGFRSIRIIDRIHSVV